MAEGRSHTYHRQSSTIGHNLQCTCVYMHIRSSLKNFQPISGWIMVTICILASKFKHFKTCVFNKCPPDSNSVLPHRWTNVRDLQLTFRQPSTCLRPNGASMLCLARCLSCNSCAKLGLVRGSIRFHHQCHPTKYDFLRWSMLKDSFPESCLLQPDCQLTGMTRLCRALQEGLPRDICLTCW